MFKAEPTIQGTGQDYADRREQPRLMTHGSVNISIQRPAGTQQFQAVLVNSSQGGLCIRHWHKGLVSGDAVCIRSDSAPAIHARIVWNWTVGPVVMSGLKFVTAGETEVGSDSSFTPVCQNQNPVRIFRTPLMIITLGALFLLLAWFFLR